MNYKLSLGLNVHTWVAYDNCTQIFYIKGVNCHNSGQGGWRKSSWTKRYRDKKLWVV
jgi:hypothetical protein